MAFRFPSQRRNFPRARGFSRGRGNRINPARWSAESTFSTTLAGQVSSATIYSAQIEGEINDFRQARPTIVRVIGRGDFVVAEGGAGGIAVGLVVVEAGRTVAFGGQLDPGSVQALAEERWMYFDKLDIRASGGDDGDRSRRFEVDLRVKRRMERSEVLNFIIAIDAGSAAISTVINWRILSRLNG